LLLWGVARVEIPLARLIADELTVELLHFDQNRLRHILCHLGFRLPSALVSCCLCCRVRSAKNLIQFDFALLEELFEVELELCFPLLHVVTLTEESLQVVRL